MVVLKGVPRILSPQILYALARMGHGDQLVLADANFPSSSVCNSGPEELRADGHGIPELLEAILKFFPLDTYVKEPVKLMQVTQKDLDEGMGIPSVWAKYKEIIDKAEGHKVFVGTIERFEFYEVAKKSFAVIATGETALYGNIILIKGALPPDTENE
ncbi:fucose mutarotase-like [Xenia sp. Carnegie-2017]|uniref:fucose mutarotase-like n=1 Tax=Xenia sp. Carnegie-2017 TaxID=2897299 RepID=UPI001F03D28B|nr:fucose mutarotase-like [Xenia sp. Carnegie-2017]